MIPAAEVKINVDEKQVREYIENALQKQIHQQIFLVDINKLSEIMCMSVRYLEDEFLQDSRVKVHERKKNRKRWWFYEPTLEAIKEIMDEW